MLESKYRFSEVSNMPSTRSKEFYFYNPEGEYTVIFNLAEYCRNKNISESLLRVIYAESRKPSKSGWRKAPKPDENPPLKIEPYDFPCYQFFSPTGELIQVKNLKTLAEEYNLNVKGFRSFWSGDYISYHGFTKPGGDLVWNEKKKYKRVHYFFNPKGDLIKINNLKEFCRNNALDISTMCKVREGKRESHKGWTRANP